MGNGRSRHKNQAQKLIPLKSPLHIKGSNTALKTPDGTVTLLPENHSGYMTQTTAKLLNAEVVLVQGVWTFTVENVQVLR